MAICVIYVTDPVVFRFAQDEPQMVKKFEAAAIAKIIRANQIILGMSSSVTFTWHGLT